MSTRPLTAAGSIAVVSPFEARANAEAARFAARDVRAYILRTGSEAHRKSLAAYEAGTRSWPWPDCAIAADTAADDAVRGLVRGVG